MKEKLLNALPFFKIKKIAVIGDIMLDKYIWGDVSRISPEAPVQVVNVQRETYAPGGAANVAANIAALSGQAYMIGIVGDDRASEKLIEELETRGINVEGVVSDSGRPTTQKVRIIGKNQQLLRVDYEKRGDTEADVENEMIDFISEVIKDIDVIVVSDYAKGAVTERVMQKLMELSAHPQKKVVIDPKPSHKSLYKNATVISPNHLEAFQMAGIDAEESSRVDEVGLKLLRELDSSILITRGEKGMSLYEKSGKITTVPTYAQEVYDIIGAGDAVVATLALGLATGLSMKEAAILANHAAGIVVRKLGTSTASMEELEQSIQNSKHI